MHGPGIHRQLELPNPRLPDRSSRHDHVPFASPGTHASWLELLWIKDRPIQYRLGAEDAQSLDLTWASFHESFAGSRLGATVPCALEGGVGPDLLLVARPALPHYWPVRPATGLDRAGLLLRTIESARDVLPSVVVQVLLRATAAWERGFLSPLPAKVVAAVDPVSARLVESRLSEEPFHAEIRVAAWTTDPRSVHRALLPWLASWRLLGGGYWRTWHPVPPRKRPRFYDAMRGHDLARFAAPKVRRDVSATELVGLLPIPWKTRLPELAYAGPPAGEVPAGLRLARSGGGGPTLGRCGEEEVHLPRSWRHLVVLGRTRSGKSSLCRSVALQLLRDEPEATVVVLEPTGELIGGLRERVGPDVADDTVELDPARNTFLDGGTERVAVPLNLIDHDGRDPRDAERRTEKVGGDLLQAIKNAWGEEAVGGRAEFILRSLIQGLSAVEGTNLVDAYTALTDKATLQRLERLALGGSLRSALRVHLPRLDYAITISSLDKVGKIATNPLLRKTLCQRYAPVPFARLLRHRLLLLNLGKGALGTEGAGFLGAILLTKLWTAVQERPAGVPPVYLVVDEFHNYAVPAFADMLSEGARLGLHVIAATQYLNRIPERVRSALVGNVDAWAVFPVGAEDQRDVGRIVQGSEHGWRPEEFVGGLRPFEAAVYAERALVKVTTLAPEPPDADAGLTADRIATNTRRYAQPEDSQASPLSVTREQVAALIEAVPERDPAALDRLAAELGWSPTSLRAAVALGRSTGILTFDPDGSVRRTARARFYQEAVRAAQTEGEEHSGLVAEVCAYLAELGLRPRVVPQLAGQPRPDAEVAVGGRAYSVEVECSTLIKEQGQTVRNVRKALVHGRRCLLVVPDRDRAERAAQLLATRVPDAELWGEVGILWRSGPGEFEPHGSIDRPPWGWLDGGSSILEEGADPVPESAGSDEAFDSAYVDPDIERVRGIVAEAIRAGRERATSMELLALQGANAVDPLEERRLGRAMAALGLPNRRARIGARQIRVYDLRADGLRRPGGLEDGNPHRPEPTAPPDGTTVEGSARLGGRPPVDNPAEEEPEPDEEEDHPGDLDPEEALAGVAGETRVADRVRDAGTDHRQTVLRGDSEASAQSDQDAP